MNLCECGCGQLANKRFIKGHILNLVNATGKNKNARSGADHYAWKGGRTHNGVGYVVLLMPEHPNANSNGQVLEHVALAAKALRRPIPEGVQIHHVDEDPGNNAPENLVVCQDQSYHRLLHRRRDALLVCGNAGYMKCEHCHKYDDPSRMWVSKTRSYRAHHMACQAAASQRHRDSIRQGEHAV